MTLKGAAGGLLAVGLATLSVSWLSRGLQNIPWTRLVSAPEIPPPVEPERIDARLERSLTPSRRPESGSVPLYIERRVTPAFMAQPREPEQPPAAPAPATPSAPPARAARASAPPPVVPPTSKFWKPAVKMQSLPAKPGEFDGAAEEAPAPHATPAAPAYAPAAPAYAPAAPAAAEAAPPAYRQEPPRQLPPVYEGEPSEAPTPHQRTMRPVMQGHGSALQNQSTQDSEPAEEEQGQ
ncbi:MAG: hypothetical protein NTX64_10220 [Elusimicrobia bacterium]|nr:hypothetical protein [Elusimicrobiota bacterium]